MITPSISWKRVWRRRLNWLVAMSSLLLMTGSCFMDTRLGVPIGNNNVLELKVREGNVAFETTWNVSTPSWPELHFDIDPFQFDPDFEFRIRDGRFVEVGFPALIVWLAFGAWPFVNFMPVAIHHIQQRGGRIKGYCPICGYNLFGNTSSQCPECGTQFVPPEHTAS